MARPGRPDKLRIPPPVPIGAAMDEPLGERYAEAYETFTDILENIGTQEGFIKINRRGKTGGMEFCEQVPATPDFSEEYVSRHWGGGVYSIHMYGPDPERPGRTKYLTAVTFHIAGAPRDRKLDADAKAPVAGMPGTDPAMVALMLELATLKGMVSGMQAQGGGGTNPLDNLEKLTNIVRNLMPTAPAGGASPNEILSFAREAVGFAKEMAPEPSDGTPWGMIIDKAVEPAIGLIGQALAAQKVGTAPTIVEGETVPVAAEIPAMTGAPMWQVELAKIVPRLLRRARDGKDPGLAAELFLEDAPGGVVEQLAELAKEEQFVPTVLALAEQNFPDVAPVRQWVADFLQAVKESLTETAATGPKIVDEEPEEPEA
jgi:hypothetical protein